jgi:hypothetical protein
MYTSTLLFLFINSMIGENTLLRLLLIPMLPAIGVVGVLKILTAGDHWPLLD